MLNCPAGDTFHPTPALPPSKLLLSTAVEFPIPDATSVTEPPPQGNVVDDADIETEH